MPEEQNGRKIFTLLEVSQSIQRMFTQHFRGNYWIKAEMNKLGFYGHTGHCFPELVEKNNGKIIAKIDALIWRDDYLNINAAFKRVLNEPLKDGIKILFLASIEFHPEYGLKLRISDIDPSFTLGDFEREKQESIRRLQAEGIFTLNKELAFPLLPKRLAIISDNDSRGYKDFMNVFEAAEETWGYKFFHVLFRASLQGDKALLTIPAQLNKIKKLKDHFDAVVLIRGGGGDLTFACYNNYELAKAFATFPLPILSGLGHVTNQTVVDMVSYESAITPTKCAEFLVQKFHDFSVPLQEAEEFIRTNAVKILSEAKALYNNEIKMLRSVTRNIVLDSRNDLNENIRLLLHRTAEQYSKQKITIGRLANFLSGNSVMQLRQHGTGLLQQKNYLAMNTRILLERKKTETSVQEKNIDMLKPENVLRRGFSITRVNGKAVTSAKQIQNGDELLTELHNGILKSTVTSNSDHNTDEQKITDIHGSL